MGFLRTAAIGVVGAAALGSGLYYTIHLEELAGLEYKYKQVKKSIDKDSEELVKTEKHINEQESLINVLSQQRDLDANATKDLESKIAALRNDLKKYEGEYRSKQAAIARVQKEIAQAKSSILGLADEVTRRKAAVESAQLSLQEVTRRVEEQKLLLNPLNHPKVKALLGK